ncbi:MAG: RnfABCDGE type electron transport complex subunit C, partial [Oscillospiraceae bacterium]
VLTYQMIGEGSVPIYSSVSGKVTDIIDFLQSNGQVTKAVCIECDEEQKFADVCKPTIQNKEDFITALSKSGIVGLGGAGFPTAVKLNYNGKIDKLIINLAECEPYITSDYREAIENTKNVVDGVMEIAKWLKVDEILVGIEENKPEAIKVLNDAFPSEVKIVALKSLYPQGAEKSIIYATTGIIIEEGKLPADFGVMVVNVSTAGFIGGYLKDGKPLIKKRITVDGDFFKENNIEPKNIILPIGTTIEEALSFLNVPNGYGKILLGGPMMGLCVPNESYPIMKNTNALTIQSVSNDVPTTACIRCGKCVSVCPMKLMPAKIEKAYDAGNVEALKSLSVNLCVSCGCCSYVCPAKRKLAQKNQLAKLLLRKKG